MKMGFLKNWMLPACLLACASTDAQTLHLKGSIKGCNTEEMDLYVKATECTTVDGLVKLNAEKSRFEGDVPAASDGFYKLFGKHEGAQLVAPLYLPDTNKTYNLKMKLQDACPIVETGKDNQALSAFNALTYAKGKQLWVEGGKMAVSEMLPFLKEYATQAEAIADRFKVSEPVRRYLQLWAYVSAYGNYEALPQATGKSVEELGFDLSEVLNEPQKVLDTPMAAYFSNASYIVYRTLPKSGLAERVAYLFDHYQDADIRNSVSRNVLEDFMRTFNFSGDFDGGLALLTEVTEKYGLDKSFVEQFKKKKASVQGKPFPEGITLKDAEGNTVDFSTFKGRYVYIDMWASWCGPCVKEVPHLQKLEKELENKDVVFVSISLDTDVKAWKSKMKALGMHGHQLSNSDNSLAEALNVKGIPFFMIYDKEGRLYMSNAPRPSHPALKELLEGLH